MNVESSILISISRYNAALVTNRRQNLDGIYDIHTNVMQYPKIMQPTHARWEPNAALMLDSPDSETNTLCLDRGRDATTGLLTGDMTKSIFPAISPVFTRNFMISDTYYVSPASSTLGYPGPDEHVLDVGSRGLTSIPDDVLPLLPEDCRQAFKEAQLNERLWKESWSCEADDAARARLRITYNL